MNKYNKNLINIRKIKYCKQTYYDKPTALGNINKKEIHLSQNKA